MEHQTKAADRTRQAFIDAFCQLYQRQPLAKITVQAVAKRAGYNRSTFYQYFLDIDDVLDSVEDYLMNTVIQRRKELKEPISSGRLFIESLVDLYEEEPTVINALFGDYGSGHFLERIRAVPEKEILGFEVPGGNRLEPYLVEYRLAGSLALFRLWLHRGRDLSIEELLSLVARLYESGMSSQAS